ncbi:MAG: replication-associated recombination protein A [Planctomycetes bacterium]|nr:replication-associated recombination protein A [Planctomycetota bacterium]
MSGNSLFAAQEEREDAASAPLAERMRPRNFDEVLGQGELTREGSPLRRALEEGRAVSCVFWGEPGTGKTTIARLIASVARARFVPFSAVLSGIAELRTICKEAEQAKFRGERTLLFVDEIHRFNKAQQDAFLPRVERGDVILVGATTENPSFALVPALQSRLVVHRLRLLTEDEVLELLTRALTDEERGLGARGLRFDEVALQKVAAYGAGDARRALTALEHVAGGVSDGAQVDGDHVERVLGRPLLVHDKKGEEHFNALSAFHKSLRNSDADAALYWMLRLLEAGEDPLVVVRRMVAFAAEDVGLADPSALRIALSALEAVRFLGMPEGRLALGNACVYLALAPKSNAVYRALAAARQAVADAPRAPVPMALRNAPTKLMKDSGYGEGYVYAHDTDAGVADMQCLPDAVAKRRFYEPTDRGLEARLAQRLRELAEAKVPQS